MSDLINGDVEQVPQYRGGSIEEYLTDLARYTEKHLRYLRDEIKHVHEVKQDA